MDYAEWTFDGKCPIYTQLYQKLKYGILSGQLPPGGSVPSIRQMAAILHININTVARSYKLISQDGLVIMPRGRMCSITSDTNFIQEKRTQEAKNLCCNYISTMEALGFSKEEARTFIQEYRHYED